MRILRSWLFRLTITGLLATSACHMRAGNHVAGGVLGRVVIYRNGVAFYERNAVVADGRLTVQVPRDKVDDFLKSLTVVDRTTGKRLSVSIPRKQSDEADGSYLTMTLETPDRKRADVMVTYVTDAPAWKPSYRVVVGNNSKVMLEGWAVVDNTTTEDWKGVLVGVGASSALAFRYDLWSVRKIDRDLLASEEKFATAPPQGVSPYAETGPAEELASLDGNEIRKGADAAAFAKQPAATTTGSIRGVLLDKKTGEKLAGVTVMAASNDGTTTQTAITDEHGEYVLDLPPSTYRVTFFYDNVTLERAGVAVSVGKATPLYAKLDSTSGRGEVVVISGTAPTIDPTSTRTGVTIDKAYTRNVPVPGRTYQTTLGSAAGSQGESFSGSTSVESQYYVDGVNTTGTGYGTTSSPPRPPPPIKTGDDKLAATVAKIMKDRKDVVVEVHGTPGTEQAAAARGQAVKNKLVDDGVPANRIHVVPRIGPGESERVRVLAIAPNAKPPTTEAPPRANVSGSDAPVGESHFFAEHPMTVRAGSSAMVAMVHGETPGGIVYLYDPISDRGDQRFAFKAVRLDNPTNDTLEPGPVTVYGEGRFIGEGITEPVPPKASIVVPFALDKQIVIERSGSEEDRIAKLVTVQRGVVTAEMQHRRETTFKITSRLAAPTKVYLRHRLESGWSLVDAPSTFTKVGDSQLFEVVLAPGTTQTVAIVEARPMERTFDLSKPTVLGMMQLFIEQPNGSPELNAQLTALLVTHHEAADLVDKIETLREQLGEYRARSGELHAQIVTLKAVKSGGTLMVALRAKLGEISERVQKATLAIVDTQEQLMLARVKFQNQLAELHLEDATKTGRAERARRR
ncbi:MAG: carboxypeptidase regulatory-like domain-containing protein [Deltaproteobacteria bacterium]|nr:carboxypeptidase regulatory-like domain-containing protein [Deltaproteobacteria bacterium]